MKKILFTLLLFLSLFMITGCNNANKNTDSNNNQTINKNEENKQQEDNTKKYINDNDEIIDFDDEDNKPDEPKTIESTLINCQDCVFAYFTDNKTFGDVVENYTKDYSTIVDKKGYQRRRFLGFILSGNKISRAFTCGIKDGKAFCIEGGVEEKYEYNVGILNQVYNSNECRYIANGKTYVCTDGNLNSDTRSDGQVSVHYDENCHIFAETKKIACY